jgi:hypothetical protein
VLTQALKRVLTRDNTLLSRPTIEPSAIRQAMVVSPLAPPLADLFCASICTNHPAGTVTAYAEAGTTPATRRAYRTDLDHFKAWGGTLPAANAQVVNYLADHATVLKVATLTRRLAAIAVAHEAKGLPNPAASPLVRATMRGIRRAHGQRNRSDRHTSARALKMSPDTRLPRDYGWTFHITQMINVIIIHKRQRATACPPAHPGLVRKAWLLD